MLATAARVKELPGEELPFQDRIRRRTYELILRGNRPRSAKNRSKPIAPEALVTA